MNDEQLAAQVAMMKACICWTLVGAFIMIVIIVVCSIVGWVKIENTGLRRTLYSILVVKLVGIGVAYFSGVLGIDPKDVVDKVVEPFKERLSEVQEEKAVVERRLVESSANTDRLRAELVQKDSLIASKDQQIARAETRLRAEVAKVFEEREVKAAIRGGNEKELKKLLDGAVKNPFR